MKNVEEIKEMAVKQAVDNRACWFLAEELIKTCSNDAELEIMKSSSLRHWTIFHTYREMIMYLYEVEINEADEIINAYEKEHKED